MRVNTFALGAVLVLLAVSGTIAARMPYSALQDVLTSESAVGGLRGTAQSLFHLTRRGKEKEEGIAAIRYLVPPSEGKNFEDAWLRLEKDVRDEEKHNDIFNLQKSKNDNLIYYSYGEWEQHCDMHAHFHTDHFQDFAKYVDDHGIEWELHMLSSESKDLDSEQRKMMENKGKKNMHHVLFHYYVPPGEADKFTNVWLDAAEKTIDEPGNRMMTLKKIVTDNTRFCGYGTWESYTDFLDHFNSRHIGRMLGAMEDSDVVWVMQPLVNISHEEE